MESKDKTRRVVVFIIFLILMLIGFLVYASNGNSTVVKTEKISLNSVKELVSNSWSDMSFYTKTRLVQLFQKRSVEKHLAKKHQVPFYWNGPV